MENIINHILQYLYENPMRTFIIFLDIAIPIAIFQSIRQLTESIKINEKRKHKND